MSEALVRTKLLLPRPRARSVARPRLDDLLARGADARLTLVSAPAGFGKTTLLAGWLRAGPADRPTAWVSLDERDRDATVFWSYVLHAVDDAAPGAATAALAQLQSRHGVTDAVLTTLLNELSVLPTDLTLVLDDYHLAEGPDVRAGTTYFLEHLPPQVHVVITTRADPVLPLARLRARGELVEVRAADLRFTGAEAAAYLNDVHALGLDPDDVAALERRTEGWAAALQLAALSLQDRDDRSGFIAGFAGDDRFVVDYLVDEVLERQPQAVRRFLLDTSVLDRLTAPLCDAVTGSTGSRAALESLVAQNLFVVPLDARGRWYRYHHLFADVLRGRLLDERPAEVPALHRRASDWYDRAGDAEAAVRHALAAGDVDLAAARVETAIPALLRERREAVVCRWVDELPQDIVENRPVLAVGFIAALAEHNAFEGLDVRLDDAERLLATPDGEQVVVDHEALARLPAAVATYRAALALVGGDLDATVEHADHALSRAPADDHLTTASASALLGLASLTRGDLDAAHHGYRVAADHLRRAGHVADVLGCTITLADIEMTRGALEEARRACEQALDLAARQPSPPRGAADMHVALGRVALERGDLAGAAGHLREADELGESAGLPQHPYRWRVAMALLREAEGDADTAAGLLEEAATVYVGDFNPNARPVDAVRARVLATSGDVAAGLGWARGQVLSVDDDLSFLHEYEHVALARVLLADHAATGAPSSLTGASALLHRLLADAEGGGRTGTVLEVLVLQSLAHDQAGHREQALATLTRAVELGEPEGCTRPFTVEGTALAGLLTALGDRRPTWSFVRRVRDSVVAGSGGPVDAEGAPARPTPGAAVPDSLVDPLSGRELDVLRYLGSELDGPEIARELGVALSTVRTHTQHIYAKLGVNNRRAAVRRAHQLHLFSRPR